MNERAGQDHEQVLRELVYVGDRYKPFGELTVEDVKHRAAELKAVSGWGPTMRAAPVAMAWAELSRLMESRNALVVADLDAESATSFAERVWVSPPGGGLL